MQPVPADEASADLVSVDPAAVAQVALGMGVLVAVAGLGIWWVFLGRKRLIQDLPTSSAQGVALGLNELVGRVECDQSVAAPQSAVECAWWKNVFYVEDGDNGWKKTGEKVGGPVGFRLVDDTGAIEVRPRRAEVHGPEAYDGPHTVPMFSSNDPNPTLASRHIAAATMTRKKRRVVEHTIPVGSEVYVLGTAQLPFEQLTPVVGEDRNGAAPFIVRVGTEDDALYRERVGVGIGLLFAIVGAVAAAIAWRDGEALAAETITFAEVNRVAPVLGVWLVLVAMAMLSVVFTYNGLVRLRQRVKNAWSLIDVQLRRRHDLIPALEKAVSAHAAHEAEVHEAIADLRSRFVPDLPAEPTDAAVRSAERQIGAETAAMHRLLALIEDYPVLSADASFAELRKALVDTEDRIALARHFYNASVQSLHDRARAVPGNLVAALFSLDLEVEFTDVAEPMHPAATEPPPMRFEANGLSPLALRRRLRA